MGQGWSEERTDFFGNKYWVHYDGEGNKVGKSEEREGFFGGKYVEHYDTSGTKVGKSEPREGFFGGKYIDHYDSSGGKVGRSEEREGFFGGKYTEHYDAGGRKVGTSEKQQGVFGGKYFEGQRDPQPFRAKRDERRTSSAYFASGGDGSDYQPSSSQGRDAVTRRNVAPPSAQTTRAPDNSPGDKKGSSLGKKVLKGLGYAVAAAVVLGVLGAASERDG